MSVAIRAFIYVVLGIGALVVWVPSLIDDLVPGSFYVPGLVITGLGAAVYLWTTWDFVSFGRGTALPVDPPRVLVIRGLYRVVRNPMALGFVLILVGEAIAFSSTALLTYAAISFIAIHLFVVLVEEPGLRERFGAPYENYCRSVRRWLPSFSALRRSVESNHRTSH